MKKTKSPTIYDVAKLAGVSITTISRVLNAPDRVIPETRTRILEAIDQLGFVPKAEARARAMRQNGRIGVISPFFTAPSFIQRLRGVAGVISPTSYELVIYTVNTAEQLQGYLASLPLAANLDGLILLSLAVGEKEVDRLLDKGLMTVLVEYPNDRLNSVEIDDIKGGYMAGEHLIKKGHRRIALLGVREIPEYSPRTIGGRYTGFTQALKEHQLDLPKEWVGPETRTYEDTYQLMQKILEKPNPPTAVFAASDMQALFVMKAVRKMGMRVPDDLAVIGFDDIDMADYADLTTIRQHLDESGRIAGEILLSHIENPSRPPQHVKLPLILVERAST